MVSFLFVFANDVKCQTEDVTQMDSCDFRMDTAYAGHLYREATNLFESGNNDEALGHLSVVEATYTSL